MDNIFFRIQSGDSSSASPENRFSLLARGKDLEIMKQHIPTDSAVWVTPADNPGVVEFFFVISGLLSVDLKNKTVSLKPGDSFFVDSLQGEVSLKAISDTEILYVTNSHIYDRLHDFQTELTKLLMQINEKDNITYLHSKNVVRYSVKLMERLSETTDQAKMDRLYTAALFHDVGKCFLPDYILKKETPLSKEEMILIYKHPIDTHHMLQIRFGTEIAEIAASHHERIDGSGYPYGLTGDQFCFESKILAVADAFDAMTSKRPYNVPKPYLDSARELYNMDTKFDRKVTEALVRLAEENAFES